MGYAVAKAAPGPQISRIDLLLHGVKGIEFKLKLPRL